MPAAPFQNDEFVKAGSADTKDPPKPHRGLRPPQFRLSTLLVAVAILCLGLSLTKLISPLLTAAICLLLLAVFAHIAGNAIGMQLRSHGDIDLGAEDFHEAPTTRTEIKNAPPTSLRNHTRLGLTTVIPTVVFAIAGAATATWGLIQYSDQPTVLNIGLGAISAAVLGGLLGFWLSSLANIVLEAVIQAHRES